VSSFLWCLCFLVLSVESSVIICDAENYGMDIFSFILFVVVALLLFVLFWVTRNRW